MYVYESIVSGGTLSIDFWIVLQATPFLPRSNDWMEDVLQLAAGGLLDPVPSLIEIYIIFFTKFASYYLQYVRPCIENKLIQSIKQFSSPLYLYVRSLKC